MRKVEIEARGIPANGLHKLPLLPVLQLQAECAGVAVVALKRLGRDAESDVRRQEAPR